MEEDKIILKRILKEDGTCNNCIFQPINKNVECVLERTKKECHYFELTQKKSIDYIWVLDEEEN